MGLWIFGIKRPIRLQHQTVEVSVKIPALTTIYSSGDAMGGVFEVPLPSVSGTITGAVLHDLDDEGLEIDVVVAIERFVGVADNEVFSLSDDDNRKVRAFIPLTVNRDFINNQLFEERNLNIDFVVPGKKLYCQAIARGTPTIAAGSEPIIEFLIRPDAPSD